MQIIPAMDLRNSKCVRLLQGQYDRETLYSENPLAIVENFWKEGARRLHCVDLEGARHGRFSEHDILRGILSRWPIEIQTGGGIRTLEQARELIALGVRRLVIGTLAVRSPEIVSTWIRELGADHFCMGLDLKEGALSMEGWTSESQVAFDVVVNFYRDLGVRHYLCTDISCDGTLAGPNIALYDQLVMKFPDVEWVASGGVASINHLKSLSNTGVSAVVIGKALYEGRFTFKQAHQAMEVLC